MDPPDILQKESLTLIKTLFIVLTISKLVEYVCLQKVASVTSTVNIPSGKPPNV